MLGAGLQGADRFLATRTSEPLGVGAMPGIEAIRPLDQPPMSAAKHPLCPVAGALALHARRQPFGCQMIFVARCCDGLTAEAKNAQWANAVADPRG